MNDRQVRDRPAGPVAAEVRRSKGGIGRPSSPTAERVSDDLRRHEGTFLDRRRRVAALSLAASAAMGAVAAYQNGLLRHLPEPPLRLFAAEVDASGEAYELFKTPDAALGLASYALTLVLAGAGTARRVEERPWLPLALAAKVAAADLLDEGVALEHLPRLVGTQPGLGGDGDQHVEVADVTALGPVGREQPRVDLGVASFVAGQLPELKRPQRPGDALRRRVG